MNAARLQQIDALRGLAAMSVMLYHYTCLFPRLYAAQAGQAFFSLSLGYLGLQLFFAISGFVIIMTLERTRSAADFLVSRFSRLYPAYWCALLLTVVGVALIGPAELRLSGSAILANLTMVQRVFHVRNADGSYWTLFVELVFYAWALLAYRLGGLGRMRGLLFAALALRLLEGMQLLPVPTLLSTFLILRFVPWFTCGIAVFHLVRHGPRAADLGLVLAATVVLAVCDAPTLGLFAPIASALLYAAARGRLPGLDARPLLWLGQISYPLYLLHQSLGFGALLQLRAAGVDLNASIALVTLLMLALASAVNRWVEQPAMGAIRRRWRQRRPND